MHVRRCYIKTSCNSGCQTPKYTSMHQSGTQILHHEVLEDCRWMCRREGAGREGLRGPVTRGILLVGNVDPHSVDEVWHPAALSALGVGEAAHWAAACHLCPPPRRRRGPQRLRTSTPIGIAD